MDNKRLSKLIDSSDNGVISCSSLGNPTYFYLLCKGIDDEVHSFRCDDTGGIYDFDDKYGLLRMALEMYTEKDFETDEPADIIYNEFRDGVYVGDLANPEGISDYDYFEKYKKLLPHLLGNYNNPFFDERVWDDFDDETEKECEDFMAAEDDE